MTDRSPAVEALIEQESWKEAHRVMHGGLTFDAAILEGAIAASMQLFAQRMVDAALAAQAQQLAQAEQERDAHANQCAEAERFANEQEQRAIRAEQTVAQLREAANKFSRGEISSGKLAEVLGCDDKRAFKAQAHAFCDADELAAIVAQLTRERDEARAECLASRTMIERLTGR